MSEHLVDGENILKIIQKLVLGTKRYFWHLLLAIKKTSQKNSKILLSKGKSLTVWNPKRQSLKDATQKPRRKN